jgi:hypothetical protein
MLNHVTEARAPSTGIVPLATPVASIKDEDSLVTLPVGAGKVMLAVSVGPWGRTVPFPAVEIDPAIIVLAVAVEMTSPAVPYTT